MIEGITERTVAVIGNAPTLNGAGLGAEIEAFDIIVRVNAVLPLQSFPADAGSRTDVVYCAYGMRREVAKYPSVRVCIVDHALRKEVARWSYLPPGYQPTTGLVAVVDALHSGARLVKIFGFDFYADGIGTGPPHDPDEDRALLRLIVETNDRLRVDAALLATLQREPI